MHLFYIYETDHEATHVVALLHCPCRPCAPTIRKLYATESNTWLTLHGPMDAILAKGFDIWDAYFFKKYIYLGCRYLWTVVTLQILLRERGFEKEYSKSGIYLESRRAMRKNEQRPRAENDRLQNIQLPPSSEKESAETNKQPRVET